VARIFFWGVGWSVSYYITKKKKKKLITIKLVFNTTLQFIVNWNSKLAKKFRSTILKSWLILKWQCNKKLNNKYEYMIYLNDFLFEKYKLYTCIEYFNKYKYKLKFPWPSVAD